ncbi:MAG: type II secretion system F family protein [Candidatus Woesearchaeota archaeon]
MSKDNKTEKIDKNDSSSSVTASSNTNPYQVPIQTRFEPKQRKGLLSKIFGNKKGGYNNKSFAQIVEENEKQTKKAIALEKEKIYDKENEFKKLIKKQEKSTDLVFTKKIDIFRQIKERRKKRSPVKRKRLRFYLTKAGYEDVDDIRLKHQIKKTTIISSIAIALISFVIGIIAGAEFIRLIVFTIGILLSSFAILFIFSWIGVYLFLDYKAYKRKTEIETVLADFLQLTSSNISAGMPIDKALWYAVRPKFGVLAKEIEEVAKATLTGEDLGKALLNFSDKYDSVVLKRSINLLLEGMQGGGEVAELLNKIALDIQEIRIMKKEMATSVLTYVIFISFATAVIAPILFALSEQLLVVINKIVGSIDIQPGTNSFLQIGGASTTQKDFSIFATLMLVITSIFSSFIISTIRTGGLRKGLKLIIVFLVSTMLIYYLGRILFGKLMTGLL